MDYNKLKKDFYLAFNGVLDESTPLKFFIYEILIYGSAYIVGGFLRDLINKRRSRDIDIIVDLNHLQLIEIIQLSKLEFSINRHKGIKVKLDGIYIDIWSIENNWAFKNNLVKLNDENKLNSIAKGCFYNFDALVINLHTKNLNIKYYLDFIENKQLDILQKSPLYKNLNPTTEANILRAFFLKKHFNTTYTVSTNNYLYNKLGRIKDITHNPIQTLIETRSNYPKYSDLTDEDIFLYVDEIIKDSQIDDQYLLDL